MFRQGISSSVTRMTDGAEEKFARAWESFLMEGNSPTPGLQEVFSDFKSKFEDVYNAVPPEQINDGIKQVFDSMFDRVRAQEYAEAAIEELGVRPNMQRISSGLKRFFNKRFGIDSPQVKFNMAMGRRMENNSRVAHWLQKMHDGNGEDMSVRSVMKYLFDYN